VTLLWTEDTNAVAVLVRDDGNDESGAEESIQSPSCAQNRNPWKRPRLQLVILLAGRLSAIRQLPLAGLHAHIRLLGAETPLREEPCDTHLLASERLLSRAGWRRCAA
jgi:hypothetical protein